MRLRSSALDISVNVICIIQLVGILVYLIAIWNSLPDQIPGHFNAAGEVTRFDGKGILLIMPIFACVMFAGFTLIERFPRIWNTGVKITEENRLRVYRVIRSLLGATKLITVSALIFATVFQSLSRNLPSWYLPVLFSLLTVTIVFSIIRLIRAR